MPIAKIAPFLRGDEMTDIRVENATREYILELMKKKIERLKAENSQLRAELASIKPDWNTAPEWATAVKLDIDNLEVVWIWREYTDRVGGRIKNAKVINLHDTLEKRP